MRNLILLLCVMLAGCEAMNPAMHPDRQSFEVDGYSISVVQRGADRYDSSFAWGGWAPDTTRIKASQIRAVEMASKCKVVAAEFLPATWILQTVVSCG